MTKTIAEAHKGLQSRLAPHLVCDGAAEAIDFYKEAFGAEEMIRIPGPDGKLMHGCVNINGAMVMLVDENAACGALSPKTLKGSPVSIHLNVDNADAAIERAAQAGATIVMPAADMFWGDRFGVIQDPFGHQWSIAHHVRDVTEAELKQAALECTCA